ncbi:MAG: twin-arginine translocation signal domain-containing protein, partial [Planctomycetales bacterium]
MSETERTTPSAPLEQSRSACCSRRAFLAGAATGTAAGGALGWGAASWIAGSQSPVGTPGPFPGKVIEARRRGTVLDSVEHGYAKRDQDAVRDMVAQGMKELVGSDDDAQAWRYFFSRGDRVGIKVVPVGQPESISSYEVVREVIRGLPPIVFIRRPSVHVNGVSPYLTEGGRPSSICVFDPSQPG